MPKGFSMGYIFCSLKIVHIQNISFLKNKKIPLVVFLLLQNKNKVKIFPRPLNNALDQFEDYIYIFL